MINSENLQFIHYLEEICLSPCFRKSRKKTADDRRFFYTAKIKEVQISPSVFTSHSQKVRENALKSVVSITTDEVSVPSWCMFRAIT